MSMAGAEDSQVAREFGMRVVFLDYHYAAPVPGLDPVEIPSTRDAIQSICVLRIFGSTPSGQKACLHVHQVRLHHSTCSMPTFQQHSTARRPD